VAVGDDGCGTSPAETVRDGTRTRVPSLWHVRTRRVSIERGVTEVARPVLRRAARRRGSSQLAAGGRPTRHEPGITVCGRRVVP